MKAVAGLPALVLLILWIAIKYEYSDNVGSGILATWLQAWFTLAAACAALFIYWKQREDADQVREKERKVRAICLAAELYTVVGSIDAEISQVQQYLQEDTRNAILINRSSAAQKIKEIHARFRANISESLTANTDHFPIFGSQTGSGLAYLVATLEDWRLFGINIPNTFVGTPPNSEILVFDLLRRYAALIAKCSRNAISDFEALLAHIQPALEAADYIPTDTAAFFDDSPQAAQVMRDMQDAIDKKRAERNANHVGVMPYGGILPDEE